MFSQENIKPGMKVKIKNKTRCSHITSFSDVLKEFPDRILEVADTAKSNFSCETRNHPKKYYGYSFNYSDIECIMIDKIEVFVYTPNKNEPKNQGYKLLKPILLQEIRKKVCTWDRRKELIETTMKYGIDPFLPIPMDIALKIENDIRETGWLERNKYIEKEKEEKLYQVGDEITFKHKEGTFTGIIVESFIDNPSNFGSLFSIRIRYSDVFSCDLQSKIRLSTILPLIKTKTNIEKELGITIFD